MKIIVSTANNIEGSEKLADWIETELRHALAAYEASLTRLEVHLKDERAGSSDGGDISCLIEARVAGLDPLAASARAATPGDAVKAAGAKMKSVLASAIGRSRQN